jgi:hypothetical protein
MLYSVGFALVSVVLAHGSQDLVDRLNEVYQSYKPHDDTSPAGVWVTAFEARGAEPYLADCQHCGTLFGLPLPTPSCRISASIINAENSHVQKDWKATSVFRKTQIALYPIGTFSPFHGQFNPMFDQGGVVFGPAAEEAMKCMYAFDGTSYVRPNRGCGCPSMISTACPPDNKNWPCPTTLNTCSNKDPLSSMFKPHPINENSSVLSACQCGNMGMTEQDDPLWTGLFGLQYPPGLPKCMWQGPQFFEGKGGNELRHALRQQHNFKETALFPWNEAVLDGDVHNNLIAQKPSEMIAAFWYPRHRDCGKACKSGIHKARDTFVEKYGVEVPVIMIDLYNGRAPFLSINDDNQEANLEEARGESSITIV